MQRSFILSLASLFLVIQSSAVFASGGYSGGGFSGSRGGSAPQPRQIDQTYEAGKAIFNGRARGEPTLQYCVVVDGEKVPLKRRAIKTYKKATYNDLASSMYQCDKPEKLISDGLTRDSFLYVLYYLNKRHKLSLRGA